MSTTTSQPIDRLVAEAKKVLPGGSFGNMPAEVILAAGKGGHIWDENGREYIDYLLGSGPMFIGHAHPEVTKAVQTQVETGSTFFGNNKHGIALAQAIVDAVPCAEQVRFVCTGTEADLYAMRAVRAFRKRDKILKFEGGYHGMSDWALMSMAPKNPGNFPRATPDSAGIPKSVADEMLIAAFNDVDMVESLIREHKDELAGVIVEPFQRLLPPQPGFLQALRRITAKHGIPLIFDEVVTGFRFAYGGAQEYYGVTPDLCTLGKIVGGGYALARKPEDITLGQVIRVLEGPLALVPCVSHTAYMPCEECVDERTCGVKLAMQEVRDATPLIQEMLRQTSVIYMMANQLPMVGLSYVPTGAPLRKNGPTDVRPLRLSVLPGLSWMLPSAKFTEKYCPTLKLPVLSMVT